MERRRRLHDRAFARAGNVSRIDGLGEMPPEPFARTQDDVEALTGRKPELRYAFVQEKNAKMDADAVDV